MKLRAPWVAVPQTTVDGVDTGRQDVVVVDLRNGKKYSCPINEIFEGRTREIVLTGRGRVGWLGETISRDPGPFYYRRVPAVAACGPAGTRILETGAGIEAGSLRLVGSTLQWVNDGALKSAAL